MAPFVFQKINRSPEATLSACKPDFSYLHSFNEVGGRPDERRGTKGSFTPGIRVMSGGPARDVPLESDVNPGTVLRTFPELKPDMSGEARMNVAGGRPTERLGTQGSFTPGIKTWHGGKPHDSPLEPDINPGTVLRTFPELKPDMSGEARTNVVGGRPTERLGTQGSFTPGVRIWHGGKPHDSPLEPDINPGTVLGTYPELKPDMSGEARTNVVGGRPTERLGTRGSFSPGVKIWHGGEPRDVPPGREQSDHGIILFQASMVSQPEPQSLKGLVEGENDESCGFFDESDFIETVNEEAVPLYETVPEEDAAMFIGMQSVRTTEGSVFRRCGSDTELPARAEMVPGPFPAF